MPATPPGMSELQAEIDAIWERSESLLKRAKKGDGYWAESARQHLRNFAHAYKRALHDAEPNEPEDLF